ncbi:MAG: hypothetical protein GDA36_02245 [Rhodobacteraceae bacterium]|nr:hypothetical protein [Paracoccaceae bacterium]
MSNTDSFIAEVTEEVRRDRLYALLRRYRWAAVVVILLIVGGATFSEYRKVQARTAAQDFGDAIIAALSVGDAAIRANRLSSIETGTSGGQAVLAMLTATALADANQQEAAVATLSRIAANGDIPELYRQIARFKSLTMQADDLPLEDLRMQFEVLAQPGAPLRLLAEEQLGLLDIAAGDKDAALDRLQLILQDAEASTILQQRVTQVIMALGGEPIQRPDVSQG